MFPWLGELVPVLWLMELELLALKGSVVSSSRFRSVYGFSMPLGSGSAFSVGAPVSAAASKWRSQHTCSAASPLLGPGIIAGASVPLTRPALLAEAC